MKLVKFALKRLGVENVKVKVKLKHIKHHARVIPTKKGYTLTISTKFPFDRKVIFHECAHIMQFELKGLIFTDELMMFDGQRHEGDDYWWYPWEIEARGLEQALEEAWCTRKKKKKRSSNIPQNQSQTLHNKSESPHDQ